MPPKKSKFQAQGLVRALSIARFSVKAFDDDGAKSWHGGKGQRGPREAGGAVSQRSDTGRVERVANREVTLELLTNTCLSTDGFIVFILSIKII